MGQMVNLFTELLLGEHGYLFSGNELAKREHGYLFFGAEETDTGGRASGTGEGEREGPGGLTNTSPSQVAGYDGRSPGASVMGVQKLLPSSPQKIGTHAPIASDSSYLKRDTHAPFRNPGPDPPARWRAGLVYGINRLFLTRSSSSTCQDDQIKSRLPIP